jgi:hypothetical protein
VITDYILEFIPPELLRSLLGCQISFDASLLCSPVFCDSFLNSLFECPKKMSAFNSTDNRKGS